MPFTNQEHLWIDEVGAFIDVTDSEGYSTYALIKYFCSQKDYCIVYIDPEQCEDPEGLYKVYFQDGDLIPATKKDIDDLEDAIRYPRPH